MRRRTIANLEEHPNLDEILGVLAQLAHVDDAALTRLAEAWRNTAIVADARRKALSPDSPLVIEVLSAFDAIAALYADDLAGHGEYVRLDPPVVNIALKAVRDAVAAAYARPILSRAEYNALIAAWRAVFPQPTVTEPDLGPAAELVNSLLAGLPVLANRCHDARGQRIYDGLVVRAMTIDADAHEEAATVAWDVAVRTGRRRVWTLLRRSVAESLSHGCSSCRAPRDAEDDRRVLGLCVDAACALLVSDQLPDVLTEQLTEPLSMLIPLPRRSAD